MRTPTFVRLNVDDILAMPKGSALTFASGLRSYEALLIEDDRRVDKMIPDEWREAAHVITVAGVTVKDSFKPLDKTERRGLGSAG